MPSLSSDAVLARLLKLHPKVIDLSLDRVLRLLDRLGSPHAALPPTVHVAGTNGKGSVVAYLRGFLEAAGYRVHAYISPHLVHFNERITVAGATIAEGSLTALLEECEAINRGEPITFFEITTAAAFLAFARTPADAAILETGLGGRLDATNVVARPALTVLTAIDLDHQHYLGETLAAIAGEKAGILKPGVACVSARQAPAAAAVVRARAAALGVPLACEGIDWSVRRVGAGFAIASAAGERRLPLPALVGEHQIANAGLAVAAADRLRGFSITDAALTQGLCNVRWRARLERLERGPLADRLPPGWELWLDGGHNPAAARTLARHARGWSDRPLHLISGMLSVKDAAGYFAELAPLAKSVATVAIPATESSFAAADLAQVARAAGADARPAASVAEALDAILAAGGPSGRVLICGSLYLAGAVLRDQG